jgi:nitrite reductase (NO-forming)
VTRPNRRAGLAAANLVVVAYLAAGAAAVIVELPGGGPTWLVVHLLLLGAASNAIVAWTGYFVSTHLQRPPLPAVAIALRLAALNIAVLAVLIGVQADLTAVAVTGATVLAMVLAVHLALLVRSVHAGRGRRFAPTARFYWAATAAVLLGVSAGATLVAGVPAGWWERVYAVHVHLNLLGWVALTVLGTQLTLWPTALRTRLAASTERVARRSLLVLTVGLALLLAGLLAEQRWLAALGLLGYLLGVLDFLVPFLQTGRQRAPRSPATLMLAASTGWLVAAVVVDLVDVLRPAAAYEMAGRVSAIVPWFLVGFVVQVLVGALSYLIPIVLGGPPAVGKRTAAALNTWGVPRVVLLNAGVLLIAVGNVNAARAGWVFVAVAIAAFVALVALAVARARLTSAAASP